MKISETTSKTRWTIDQAHSALEFRVRHLMISHVKGRFMTFDASIYTNARDFSTAEIDLWIDVSSISTGDRKRDAHLTSEDFFDVDNHKQIAFTSSTVEKGDKAGDHELWGELTMRGITRVVKLKVHFGGIVTDPQGNEKAGFTVTGKLNRSDWGLVWNAPLEAGGVLVSNEVEISCELELTNTGKKVLKMELQPSMDHQAVL